MRRIDEWRNRRRFAFFRSRPLVGVTRRVRPGRTGRPASHWARAVRTGGRGGGRRGDRAERGSESLGGSSQGWPRDDGLLDLDGPARPIRSASPRPAVGSPGPSASQAGSRPPVGRECGAGDPGATRPWTSMRRDRDRAPSRESPAAPIPRRTDPRPTSSAAPAPPAGDLPPLNGHGKGPFFRDTRASLSRSHADAAYCPVDSGLRARDDVQPKEDGLGRAGPRARAISLFSRDPDHRIGQRTGVH